MTTTSLNTTVLLVDDEKPFVDAMMRRLDKRGFEMHTAFDASEALAVIEKLGEGVDVVVLDVKMPGMDGIDALKEIKSREPLVEVIMLTGHGTVESAIEGMKRGAFDFLLKPCDIDELTAKIKAAKGKKAAQEQKILEARSQHIVLRRGD